MNELATQEMDSKHIELASDLDIDLSKTINQRMTESAQHLNTAYRNIVTAGLMLTSVKAECAHGEFSDLCEKHGFTRQRASEAMRLAALAAALPKPKRAQILELPKKKVLALASMDADVLEEAMEDESFVDDVANLSYQDMRERLRRTESQLADRETDLNTAETKIKDLQGKLANKQADSGNPEYVDIMRHESNALAEASLLASDGLVKLAAELEELIHTGDGSASTKKYNTVAAASLLTQTRAAAARALQAFSTIEQSLTAIADVTDVLPGEIIFSEAEIIEAIAVREDLIAQHKQEAIIRENERIARQPKKRGGQRKPKSV